MKVLFSGTFNPFHKSHEYIYNVASDVFGKDNVTIGIGVNDEKKDVDYNAIVRSIVPITKNVIQYQEYTGIVAKKMNFDLLIRGIRPDGDSENEFKLAHWNREVFGINTFFIPVEHSLSPISSSVLRMFAKDRLNLDKYINPDVYHRWLYHNANSVIYFGKCCSGKSTYIKSLHGITVDVDTDIWNTKNEFYKPFFKDTFYKKGKISDLVEIIAKEVDWKRLLRVVVDFPALGIYWQHIPVELRSRFELVKVSTSDENRKKFAETRNVNPQLIECSDFYYQDPPYWDREIIITDKGINK